MSVSNFKSMLARIKQDFASRIALNKQTTLHIEEVAHLVYQYFHDQPFALRQQLLKGTGKHFITWDDLLQYLQEDLAVHQAVKKIQHSPLSATQIIDKHSNQFSKLVYFVKQKETNAIQSIQHLPVEAGGPRLLLVCFERQILFYDMRHMQVLSTLQFKYSHVEQKLWQKQQQKRIQKQKQDQIQALQISDKVQMIVNRNQSKSRQSQRPMNILTNNIRSSVRGSSMSSEKSNDRVALRKFNTDSGQYKKRSKSNLIKIKNDDVKKVFQLFQQASLENSIAIAQAFTEARSTFQKNIVIDKTMLEKDRKQNNLEMSSAVFHRNYQKELQMMRQTNKQLGKVRIGGSLQINYNKKKQTKISKTGQKGSLSTMPAEKDILNYFKQKKQNSTGALAMQNKVLEIVNLCVMQNLLLISLFNRQIRLFKLKRSLNRIKEEHVFDKCYKDQISFVSMYRSQNNNSIHIALALDKGNHTQFVVYHLDQHLKIKTKAFTYQLNYSAKCQAVLPLGVVLFNQLGNFSLFQLNNSLNNIEQKLSYSVQLINTQTNYRVSICQLKIHHNLIYFYIGCSHGFMYQYDRYAKCIKYQTKICSSAVLDFCLIHDDKQVLVLYGNGNIAILSTLHLQKIFIYQSYREIIPQSKLLFDCQDNFYVYMPRNINSFALTENQEKQFNNLKPIKILKSRMKLKLKQKAQTKKIKITKIIEGKGGKNDFLALLVEHGEIIILNSDLQYMGSYHFLKVGSIVDIDCNQCHQFIALLLDNNSIQVINLYTQSTLFTVKQAELNQQSKFNSRQGSILASRSQKQSKIKSKNKPNVTLVHFLASQSTQTFLSIVTKNNMIHHYSDKGILLLIINLQQSCGDMSKVGPMIYQGEQLVFASGKDLVVLHRKSYNRKCVLRATDSDVVKLRRSLNSKYLICGMDSSYCIFLANIQQRYVKVIYSQVDVNRYDLVLFCQLSILKQSEESCQIIKIREELNDKTIQVQAQKYFMALLNGMVVKVNKLTGKLCKFNHLNDNFQDVVV